MVSASLIAHLKPLPPRAVERYAEAVLAEYRAIRELDKVRLTLDPKKLADAERVNDALCQLGPPADSLADVVTDPEAQKALRRIAASARSAAVLTPTLMQERWRRVREGETTLHTIDELRRDMLEQRRQATPQRAAAT